MQSRRGRLGSSVKSEDSKSLKVYICTWNVSTVQPYFDLDKLLQFSKSTPDICVFGFQEVNSKPWQRIYDFLFNDPWTNELTCLLSKLGYVRIKSTRLVGILLNVFVKRELVTHVRYSIEDYIRLGYFGLWGNKGANLCTLNIGGFNLCFINSHLSAHEHQDKKRKLEYSAILNKHKTSTSTCQDRYSLKEDYQFMFGDLNFRIEGLPIDYVKELIEKKEYDRLLEFDQLKKCMDKKECFLDVHEKTITFPPTYKFDPNTNTYDTSTKKRVPSWCDRILYKTEDKESKFIHCEQLSYNHIPEFDQSDHKPVYSLFQVKVGNLELHTPDLLFNDIFHNGKDVEITYQLNANVVTHNSDWIGVYKENFMSIDDYVTYIYPERAPEFEKNKLKKDALGCAEDMKTVKKKTILKSEYIDNGVYFLGYFSTVSRQLISISSQFSIKME